MASFYSITGMCYSDDDYCGNFAKGRSERILVNYKVPMLLVTL